MQTELEELRRYVAYMRPRLVAEKAYKKALQNIVKEENKKEPKSRAWHIAFHALKGS